MKEGKKWRGRLVGETENSEKERKACREKSALLGNEGERGGGGIFGSEFGVNAGPISKKTTEYGKKEKKGKAGRTER